MMNQTEVEECWSTEEGYAHAHSDRYDNPFNVPIRLATEESLQGFGHVVRDFDEEVLQIEPWPKPGWRELCPGTGINASPKEGDFRLWWEGDLLRSMNVAAGEIGTKFITGRLPRDASSTNRSHVLVRDMNYHPDGGQVFFPRNNKPYVTLLAPPVGDNITPSDVVAFYFEGGEGFQIQTGAWHQSLYPTGDEIVFRNKQNATYACIMVDFVKEFGQYLKVPLGI